MLMISREFKPKVWLFERVIGKSYSASSLQKVFLVALRKSGARKEVSAHLRHSFATHFA